MTNQPRGSQSVDQSRNTWRHVKFLSSYSNQCRGGDLLSCLLRSGDLHLFITKVYDLDNHEESVIDAEVLLGPLCTVVLDVRVAASSKDVVITSSHWPVEVRHTPLVVDHVSVTDEVRSPGWFLGLDQVARQNLCRKIEQYWPRWTCDEQSWMVTSDAEGFLASRTFLAGTPIRERIQLPPGAI